MSQGPQHGDPSDVGSTASRPLQHRLQSGAQPLERQDVDDGAQADAEREARDATDALGYATLGLLDGTVIARLPCGVELGTAVIGRGSLSDIRIHDPWIHRVHAHIDWDVGLRAHVISHVGGINGTFVNLQRVISPTRLTDGARVRVGKTELVYRRIR